MKGTKLCLLGISIALLGISVATNNIVALGAALVGVILNIAGLFVKD